MNRPKMNLAVPESMREYIDTRVSVGHYSNAGHYIRDLIEKGMSSGPASARSEAEDAELLAIARGEMD